MSIVRSAAKVIFATADLVHRPPAGPRLLIYHQVGSGLGRQMEVTTKDFIRQLDWLSANRHVIGLDEALTPASRLDSQTVVLTFDDGYRDTFETAFPLMIERGLPFALYVCTEHLETGRPLDPSAPAEPLTWEMVRRMLDSGLMTIGAHTHTHADLRSLGQSGVEQEVSASDSVFENRIGFLPRHFAYPWGYWSEAADEVIRLRYASAVLGAPVTSDSPFDLHRFHRYPVQLSDGFGFFKARLRGGFLHEERLRRRLRGYSGP
jgi:peptidoglycan/xylan/chitin deacetylase (PgdA/CDA1 family)